MLITVGILSTFTRPLLYGAGFFALLTSHKSLSIQLRRNSCWKRKKLCLSAFHSKLWFQPTDGKNKSSRTSVASIHPLNVRVWKKETDVYFIRSSGTSHNLLVCSLPSTYVVLVNARLKYKIVFENKQSLIVNEPILINKESNFVTVTIHCES